MKFRTEWLFSCFMFVVLFIILTGGSYILWTSDKMIIWYKLTIQSFLLLFIIAMVAGFLHEFIKGRAYYIIHDFPATSFTEIRQYGNCIIFAYKDTAWTYTREIEKLSQLKNIKVIEYYTRKKKCLGWVPVPYWIDLDKQLKDQENAPVAQ